MVGTYRWPHLAAVILMLVVPCLVLAGKGSGPGKGKAGPGPEPGFGGSTTIDNAVMDSGGYRIAVAVDPRGSAATVYFRGTELIYAVQDGGSWNIQPTGVHGGDYGATAIDLDINQFGEPGVVFLVSRIGGVSVNWIMFATRDSGTWKSELVDNGAFPSIAAGPFGEWVVAFLKTEESGIGLKIAERGGAVWYKTTVTDPFGPTAIAYGPSLAVDSIGRIGVSYGLRVPGVLRRTDFARRSGGVWRFETVLDAASSLTTLAFDEADRPHVGMLIGGGTLRIGSTDGAGKWHTERLPWKGSGRPDELELDLDAGGVRYVIAYDTGSRQLHMISGATGSFKDEVIAGAGTVGMSNSMRIDRATGRKLVTFYDQTGHLIRFMEF